MVTTATKPPAWVVGFQHPAQDATLEQQKQELLRCRLSAHYFIHKYVYIYDAVASDWRPFELWPAQVDVLTDLVKHRMIVMLKARQIGMTWLSLGFALWLMLFKPAATILLFSKRDDEAIDLLDMRLKGMYTRLPTWMQARTVTADSKHEFQLSNGSRALAFPTTGGDSYTGTLVIMDEFDLVKNQSTMMGSVKPTIDNGGRLILLSRPDKSRPGSYFKNAFRGAQQNENDFHAVFVPWTAHPARDTAWYEAVKQDILSTTSSVDGVYEQYPATPEEALARAYSQLVYPNFSVEGNVTEEADYVEGWPLLWMCDDGYAFGDGPGHENYHPRVILIGQHTPLGGINIFYEYIRCNVADYKVSIRDARDAGYPGPRLAWVDSAAAMFRGALHAEGIRTVGATHKVSEGIKNVRRLIEDGNGVRLLKVHPRCEHTIREVLGYSYDTNSIVAKAGEPVPLKLDDHCPDCIRYGAESVRPKKDR